MPPVLRRVVAAPLAGAALGLPVTGSGLGFGSRLRTVDVDDC